MENTQKPQFDVLRAANTLNLNNKAYYVSVQKITQPGGSSSDHLVVKKQPMNEDGSPQGSSKQLFVPISDAAQVLEHTTAFFLDKKK